MDTFEKPLKKAVLVTHVHPDLDALLGIWILVRFGNYSKGDLVFVPVGRRFEGTGNVIHVDTGMMQFDHHQRSDFTCAAKLVYESVFAGKGEPVVAQLVDYALKTDWYLIGEDASAPFALNSMIEGLNRLYPEAPRLVAERTFEVLDALYQNLSLRLQAEREYAKGFPFDSVFGQAFAIESATPYVREVAYRKGAHVFVFVDSAKGYRGYMARSQEGIDFTDLFKSVKALEPGADWFLHSSKELLLCGSQKAPDRKLSSLSLQKLVELIRSPQEIV